MRTTLLLGERSPYGLAHLEPIMANFNVVAVVIATPQRWQLFQSSLSGQARFPKPTALAAMLTVAKGGRRSISLAKKAIGAVARTNPVRAICARRGVPLISTFDANAPGFLEKMRRLEPTLLLSAAYPQIFQRELLSLPPRGAVNFHPSLLPAYRGAHPHFWAIARGESHGGITAHFMTEDLDAGDIVAQIRFPIASYYYSELYERLRQETPAFVKMVRDHLVDPNFRAVPQSERSASMFQNDREIHRRVFWEIASCREIHNLMRTERAYFFVGSRKVTVHRAETTRNNRNMTNNAVAAPGTIVDITDQGVTVATRSQGEYVVIRSVHIGSRSVGSDQWVSACKLSVGRILG